MRSTEFINEAGSDRPAMTDAEWAARQAQGQKNLDALKSFGQKFSGASNSTNQPAAPTTPGYLRDRDGNPVLSGNGTPWRTPNSPEPAAAAPDAATAAPPEPAPAPAPAPVQNADPVLSFNVPGAAQAGQGGSNYTTGVAQDRPHRPDAGADETTRNDYPFSPPGPNTVKPVQNPLPVPKPTVTTDPNQRIKRQSGGTRKPWGTVKDKDGRQVYIDNDGGKWVWPPNTSAWQPANLTPGADYIDKALPTTTGYTPPGGNNATPATTGGYPDRITDPEGYKKEIDRRLLKKYAGNEQPAASNATPPPAAAGSVVVKSGDTLSKIAAANGTTVQAIMAANPSIKDANRIAAGQTVKLRESSEVARIRHLAGLTRN